MAILKLKEAGDSHTMKITGCRVVKGQYGEQVEFVGADGNTIFVGREPADRQLARCGYDFSVQSYDDVTDSILTFAREANTTKKGAAPFWSITLAGKADLAPKAPPKRLQGPPSDSEPPKHHRESGVPDAPADEPSDAVDVMLEVKRQKREDIAEAYEWAVDMAQQIQRKIFEDMYPPTADSIQAGAATLLIQAEKRGAI